MNNHRLVILLLIAGYVFSPVLFNWMINPEGAWFRPYIIWALIIVVAYLIQGRRKPNDF